MAKKKVLIIGPIADFGGRELMSGFIAGILSDTYDVDIVSTGDISNHSQARDLFPNGTIYSIKDKLFRRFPLIASVALLSYLLNKRQGKPFNYVNSVFAKKHLGYESKTKKIIRDLVGRYDLVLINAQLSSKYNDVITAAAKNAGIKVLFRTTGTINGSNNYPFLRDVDLFIHHSEANAQNLRNFFQHQYVVIGQCSFIEKQFLNIPLLNTAVSRFLHVGRISEEKGIRQLIASFLHCSTPMDILTIVGSGPLLEELEKSYTDENRIRFKGFIASSDIDKIYEDAHCVIISSPEESGPLVGVEAMAAAKIILSTKVGAMPERLAGTLNNFWFEINNETTFKIAFENVKNLSPISVSEISENLRARYAEQYSLEKVSNAYISTIDNTIADAPRQ